MTPQSHRPTPVRNRFLSLILSATIALAPLSSQAGVDIAQQPLSVADPVPPNIMFIMDDSGSMAWQHMPGTTATWSAAPPSGLPYASDLTNDIRLRASNVNTQWYNPLITYSPWLKYDGSSYGDASLSGALKDPSGKSETGSFDFQSELANWPSVDTTTNSSYTDSWRYSGFYLLNPNASATNDQNYVRYEFRYEQTCTQTQRQCTRYDWWGNCTRWGDVCVAYQSAWKARKITLTSSGGDSVRTDLTQFDWTAHGGPVRTIQQEIQNYANWYSYYRLRATMAKASASRVFAKLGTGYRIGYNTIWNRQDLKIPVGTDNGLFRGDNKKDWFNALFDTDSTNGTPLRQALGRAGEYFTDTAGTGPYGPETGSNQVSCRQNFAIMTTDGYWNSDAADNSDARADNDSTNGSSISGLNGKSYKYVAGLPYKDGRSNTLADVAMYYWKTDLVQDLVNNVPTSAKNPAFWQHMRTYGISIGEKGTLDPKTDLPALTAGTKTWPEPGCDVSGRNCIDRQANIDDLWHAAVNSRGEFIVASNPDEFTKALGDTLNAIKNETKSAASGGSSSTRIEAGAKAIFSQYTSGSWNGNLLAYNINETTGLQDTTAPAWTAESMLPAWASRSIYVSKDGASVPFRYSNLNAAQQTALGSQQVVDYLRGDRSQEQPSGTMRARAGVLPAFVNSQLVYVGPPSQTAYFGNASFTGASQYAAYASSKQSRTPIIYVAGNNGMLHAFNGNTGAEVYAFLPNFSIMHPSASATQKTLKLYTDPKYGLNDSADADWETYKHRYILDGELTVADVYLSGAWKTILVGTQGRGGTGVFALDVTDPADIKFLWEKTSSDSTALGNNLGKPIIAQVASGDWRVILGNGPNSTGDKAQLVMIKLSDASISTVDTGAGENNGLAGVNLWDADKDGFFETAYAGDLKGNLWRFKGLGGTATVAKLFATRNARPITAMPLIVRNQKTNKTWVFFGTGQNLNKVDQENLDVQSWYGMMDDGSEVASSKLRARAIGSSGTIGARSARVLESGTEAEIISAGQLGWYIDFPANGERMITPNSLLGGALFGTTYTPDNSDTCAPDGKSSLWAINPFSGARLNQGIFDVNGDGVVNGTDKVNGVFPSALDGLSPITSGQPPITVGKDGKFSVHLPGESIGGKLPIGVLGRQSWREIIGQ